MFWIKTTIVVAVIAVMSYLGIRTTLIEKTVVPEEFSTARNNGALLALEIGVIAQNSLSALNDIATHDRKNERGEALLLIAQQITKAEDLRERAVKLSTELAKMGEQIPNITPSEARSVVAEAMSYEIAMVGRLMGYNQLLRELFETLRNKLTSNIPHTNGQVQKLVNEINVSSNSINALNNAFNETMTKFDKQYTNGYPRLETEQ